MDTRQVSKPEMAGNFTLTVRALWTLWPSERQRGNVFSLGDHRFRPDVGGTVHWHFDLQGRRRKIWIPRAGESRRRGRKILETCQTEQRGSHGLNPYSF